MFADRLKTSLSLQLGDQTHEIPGGNITAIELDLCSHGFTAAVELIIAEDEAHGGKRRDPLREAFFAPDLARATLIVAAHPHDAEKAAEVEPIEVVGIVRGRSVVELPLRKAKDLPIFLRRYRIEFADPAQVLWTQHFPCQLYTGATMKRIIEEHAGEEISLDLDCKALDAAQPMTFLNLEERHGASFYDFALWFCDAYNLVWTYDYAEKQHAITDAKNAEGEALPIFGDDVDHAEVRLPAVPRYQRVVLDSYSEATRQEVIEQEHAVAGIRRDILLRTPISQVVDDRVTREGARVPIPLAEAELALGAVPLVGLVPGTLVEFPADQRWSQKSALVGETWRVWRLRLRAHREDQGPEDFIDMDHASYAIDMRLSIEGKDEPRVRLPSFRAPLYPGHVEGTIVSEQGEDEEWTYQPYENADTSVNEYKVAVPLWPDADSGEPQQIAVPFEPYYAPGSIYLPAYKGARVLLALAFDRAHIVRFLDWRTDAALPMDGQGEHLVLGKSETSRTSVQHVYEDEKPVFRLARINDKDTALFEISEGTLYIQVQESE